MVGMGDAFYRQENAGKLDGWDCDTVPLCSNDDKVALLVCRVQVSGHRLSRRALVVGRKVVLRVRFKLAEQPRLISNLRPHLNGEC